MLHGWENFYIMAGTAAATFAGLLFVVLTLSVGLSTTPAARGVHGFVTPVLVHFGGVLFLSLIMLAPWQSPWPVGLILGVEGLGGIGYATFVIRLVRRLDFVSLDAREWIAYAAHRLLRMPACLSGQPGSLPVNPSRPTRSPGRSSCSCSSASSTPGT